MAFLQSHPFLIVIAWIVWIVPLYRLLGRVGFKPAWAFVALFPPAGMVALWAVAFSRWKITDAAAK